MSPRRTTALLLAASLAPAAFPRDAGAQDAYTLYVAPPVWSSTTSESNFYGVNDSGVVLGITTLRDQLPNGNFTIRNIALQWTVEDGWLVDGPRGYDAINDDGDGAGSGAFGTVSFTDGGSGIITPFDGDVAVAVLAINASGVVAGYSVKQGQISHGVRREALLWTAEGGSVSFRDVLPEAGAARDINDAGEVVGIGGNGLFEDNQAFYYDSATNTGVDLHPLLVSPGMVGVRSEANGINNAGRVVGWRDTGFGGDRRGFMWTSDEGVTLLPAPFTNPRAINDDGVIVGQNYRYTQADGLVDLHTLTDAGDFTIAMAQAISDTGVIVGWGRRPGNPLATAFALVPVAGGCNAADMAEPLGGLTFADITAFLGAYNGQDSTADLAEPFGSFTFADITAFLAAFNAGCP